MTTKLSKFAIDNGRPQECAGSALKRNDKDRRKWASPKPTLAAISSVTTWVVLVRPSAGSLAEAPWFVAGELILIPNTQPAAASQNFGQIRQFKVALTILTRLKMN